LPVGCADLAADTLMGVKFDKSYSHEAGRLGRVFIENDNFQQIDVAGIYRGEEFSRDIFLLCLGRRRLQISGSVAFSARRSI
jgi:hypothetical protein